MQIPLRGLLVRSMPSSAPSCSICCLYAFNTGIFNVTGAAPSSISTVRIRSTFPLSSLDASRVLRSCSSSLKKEGMRVCISNCLLFNDLISAVIFLSGSCTDAFPNPVIESSMILLFLYKSSLNAKLQKIHGNSSLLKKKPWKNKAGDTLGVSRDSFYLRIPSSF